MAKQKTNPQKAKPILSETINLPEGVQFSLNGTILTAKKDNKQISRIIPDSIEFKIEGNKIEMISKKSRKNERRMLGTVLSHVKNMAKGLAEGFSYELEICNVHFPITVAYDKAKKEFSVKNLLGEKTPRKINSIGDVEVEIKAPKIIIKSYDLESAGQTAANLEKVSKIRYRDRNKFQDGIFITKKPGVEFV